jgi:hypothetical protein
VVAAGSLGVRRLAMHVFLYRRPPVVQAALVIRLFQAGAHCCEADRALPRRE